MEENNTPNYNSIEKLEEMINRLSQYKMLDIYERICDNGKVDYFIPYVMNDAVESYIHLKDCRLTGTILPEFEREATSELVFPETGNRGLIVKQEDNVFTIWFSDFDVVCEYYRYHLLGHCWRKGEDIYRRLCYIIGTIYDKYKFLGQESCNEREFQAMQLLGCKAFRYYSPIDDPIDVYYEEEELERLRGDQMLRVIADDVGCKKLTKELDHYIKRSQSVLRNVGEDKQVKRIADMLLEEENWPIYDALLDILSECSRDYPVRCYDAARQQEFDQIRSEVHTKMAALGFEGNYPDYHKDTCAISIVEEHPFTIEEMEYEDFSFNQHFIVSIDETESDKIHMGFFSGKGHRGFVVNSVEELKEYIQGGV